jgi:hypothetical protein
MRRLKLKNLFPRLVERAESSKVDPSEAIATRHLLIAGTGRAGTSLLVRYLTEMGMDTTLSRHEESAVWSNEADAGLEESPHALFGKGIPYVVKSPWLHLVIDEALAKARDRIDAVIVPIRDLSLAAKSRTSVERRAMTRTAPWLCDLEKEWDVWATTPGGVIYSVDEVDQQRLLAVGFYKLIEKCVESDVPLVFLHFPRFAEDSDYLFSQLERFLPASTDINASRAALAKVSDRSKIHFR